MTKGKNALGKNVQLRLSQFKRQHLKIANLKILLSKQVVLTVYINIISYNLVFSMVPQLLLLDLKINLGQRTSPPKKEGGGTMLLTSLIELIYTVTTLDNSPPPIRETQ